MKTPTSPPIPLSTKGFLQAPPLHPLTPFLPPLARPYTTHPVFSLLTPGGGGSPPSNQSPSLAASLAGPVARPEWPEATQWRDRGTISDPFAQTRQLLYFMSVAPRPSPTAVAAPFAANEGPIALTPTWCKNHKVAGFPAPGKPFASLWVKKHSAAPWCLIPRADKGWGALAVTWPNLRLPAGPPASLRLRFAGGAERPTVSDWASALSWGRDESELVTELQAGSETAFDWLVNHYHAPVYNLILGMLGDTADAADAAQEVFLKAFKGIRSFRQGSSLKTWLYRIAIREALNHRRWFKRHLQKNVSIDAEPEDGSAPLDIEDLGATPYDQLASHEIQVAVQSALQQVPEVFRSAVILRDIEGLSYEEVAEVLECSVGTVKSRILRGRRHLKEILDPLLGEKPASSGSVERRSRERDTQAPEAEWRAAEASRNADAASLYSANQVGLQFAYVRVHAPVTAESESRPQTAREDLP